MADAFATIPVRTDTDGDVVIDIATGAVVGLTGAVPAGANSIGTVGLDAGVNSIGSVDINAAQTIGLDAGVNSIGTVGLDAGVNSIGTVGLDAGTNIIGKVEIVGTTGSTEHETGEATAITNSGGTGTINFAAIGNGNTATLKKMVLGSSVAMKYEIRTDDTVSPVLQAVGYIPVGGGTVELEFETDAITQAGTASGEHFDVIFTNLDKKDDADAHATATWVEE